MRITWDPRKASTNLEKHGIRFEDAAKIFDLPEFMRMERYDAENSDDEDRFQILCLFSRGVIFVVYAEMDEDDESIRLISARPAELHEAAAYYAYLQQDRS